MNRPVCVFVWHWREDQIPRDGHLPGEKTHIPAASGAGRPVWLRVNKPHCTERSHQLHQWSGTLLFFPLASEPPITQPNLQKISHKPRVRSRRPPTVPRAKTGAFLNNVISQVFYRGREWNLHSPIEATDWKSYNHRKKHHEILSAICPQVIADDSAVRK